MARKQKRVFILGGGAALGAHHVGALRFLEEQDVVPDAIIGSSIGVINACCYASGGVAGLERAWREFSSLPRIFSPSIRHNPLVGLSFFSMDRLTSAIEQHIDFERVWNPEGFALPDSTIRRGNPAIIRNGTCGTQYGCAVARGDRRAATAGDHPAFTARGRAASRRTTSRRHVGRAGQARRASKNGRRTAGACDCSGVATCKSRTAAARES